MHPAANQVNSNSSNIQRNIRVFVSSTFRDMEEERNLLMSQVWPQLRSFCRERNVEFVEVDLRWGITEEESIKHNTLKICLDEIKACRPYFICLLGERYGWVPPTDAYNNLILVEHEWLKEHQGRSITELEVLYGVLNQPEIAGRSYFYFRDSAYAHARGSDFFSENEDLKQKQAVFKDSIRKCCHHYQIPLREDYANPAELVSWILEDLKLGIEQNYPIAEVQKAVSREAQAHEAFAASRRKIYIHRQSNYEVLDQHALASDGPLVIIGEAGSGKSALVANWINQWQIKHPEDYIFQHYIGATPDSSDYLNVISRSISIIKDWTKDPNDLPTDKNDLIKEFVCWLSKARMKGVRDGVRFIMVIDSIDQMENIDQTFSLGWLPDFPFKDTLRLIITTQPSESLDILTTRNWNNFKLDLLCAEEKQMIIPKYLNYFGKNLDQILIDRIVSTKSTSNPLFLKIMLDELRVYATFEKVKVLIDLYLSMKDIPSLIQQVLYRYQLDYNKGKKNLVEDSLSYIYVARHGLSESELVQLLKPEGTQKLPFSIWAPFRAVLEDHLVNNNGVWNFSNNYFRKAVKESFLFNNKLLGEYRVKLADFFESLPIDTRICNELPWLLKHSKLFERLENWLLNIDNFMIFYSNNANEFKAFWNKRKKSKSIAYKYILAFEKWTKNKPYTQNMIICSNLLGSFLGEFESFPEAEVINEFTLELAKSVYGDQNPKYANAINNLAYFRFTNDPDLNVEDDYLRAIEILEKCNETESLQFVTTLLNLANCYKFYNEYDKAISLNKRAIAILMQLLGANDPDVADAMRSLSGLYYATGRYLEAVALILESIKIYENHFGRYNSSISEELFRLGRIQGLLNNLEMAAQFIKESIDISKILNGYDQVEIADQLYELSQILVKLGKRNQAILTLEEAVIICNNTKKPEYTFIDLYRRELEKIKLENN